MMVMMVVMVMVAVVDARSIGFFARHRRGLFPGFGAVQRKILRQVAAAFVVRGCRGRVLSGGCGSGGGGPLRLLVAILWRLAVEMVVLLRLLVRKEIFGLLLASNWRSRFRRLAGKARLCRRR